MKTLVLGAGVIGVASAYYLARAGHRVQVIDRQPGAGLETSFANGGQISASHTQPWAGPGTLATAVKWLGRPGSPLRISFKADPRLWSWCLSLARNCTAGRERVNAERMHRIAHYSLSSLAELREETAIQYHRLAKGILTFYRQGRELGPAQARAETFARLGSPYRVLDRAGCIAVEPALARSETKLAGGIYFPEDESGDAHAFTDALAGISAGLGVEFRYGVAVKRLVAEGNRITAVETDAGAFAADAYVLALGSYSPLLARPLGLNLPIYPAKGYSVTIPIGDLAAAPEVSLLDDERKLVYSRLGNRLRVAGMVDIVGYDTSIPGARIASILEAAKSLFPGLGEAADVEPWAGLRPKTPDSVPIIGPTPYANLFLNTGHGYLGWTMACGSGRVVADLVGGKKPGIDMAGLGLDRFA